ncbi:MAG TPA: S1/P1 nuclease [Fimbriimonadaceae bacterium]|nr:S1/P1 nuclease [Fimbriimonadaceae bacterium]
MFRLVLASLCLVPSVALAWIDTGHMLVSAVAEPDLKPQVRKEIDRLLKIGGTETTRSFWTASCWADDTKARENAAWHYINFHFRTDGKPVDNKPLEENVVWAIERFKKVLSDAKRPEIERADALRYLIHFVGDVHQPLHATARDSEAYPRGDRGGNEFKVRAPQGMRPEPRNLHFLWDIGGGLYGEAPRPLQRDTAEFIENLAKDIRRQHTRASLKETKVTDPAQWAQEGVKLAKEVVYTLPEDSVPSAEYLAKCKAVCRQQIALAGYRLADLLNELLD